MAGKVRNKKAESENFKAKKVVVEEIKGKIQSSKSVVLASYDRLTVAEVTALRGKFTQAHCEYKVYKNTLVRKAFEELGVTAFNNDLNGATVFVFCPDETRSWSRRAKKIPRSRTNSPRRALTSTARTLTRKALKNWRRSLRERS